MGKFKEKIIEKGTGFVVKGKVNKQLQKILPKTLSKQISKQVGKLTEHVTSKAIDVWNYFKK